MGINVTSTTSFAQLYGGTNYSHGIAYGMDWIVRGLLNLFIDLDGKVGELIDPAFTSAKVCDFFRTLADCRVGPYPLGGTCGG